jgi:calcineurin-like phosphoesterase
VGGCDADQRIREYLSGIPDWTRESWAEPEMQGVLIEIESGGKAISIERIKLPVAAAEDTTTEEETA